MSQCSVKLNGLGTSSVLHLWRVGSKCLGCVVLTGTGLMQTETVHSVLLRSAIFSIVRFWLQPDTKTACESE